MEKVSKFNEYGKVLRCETALMEMSKTLSEIGQMAESYAMTESGDYFQSEAVKRDFNDVKKITKDFSKLSRECYGGLQQLNALYEDMGSKMERYFEIASLDEIAQPPLKLLHRQLLWLEKLPKRKKNKKNLL